MTSLIRPKKITVKGSDGALYSFLVKPQDDLRKDARLMDFNAMINKLLKRDSESRRRNLCERFARAALSSLGITLNALSHTQTSGRTQSSRWTTSAGSASGSTTRFHFGRSSRLGISSKGFLSM